MTLVPAQTSSAAIAASASLPIMFDFSPNPGDPDLTSSGPGAGPLCTTAPSATYTPPGGTATAGVWDAVPSECGPYSGPAPAGTADMAMFATTKAFDPAVTSDTGDIWPAAIDPAASFSPVVLPPGQTAVVNVTITPAGTSGTVVSGKLFVDNFVDNVPPFGQISGDELAAIPYTYKIK